MATGVKKPGLWDRGISFDVRVQNVLEKETPVWQTEVCQLGLKKPGQTDQGVATRVTKFRMAYGGLNVPEIISEPFHFLPMFLPTFSIFFLSFHVIILPTVFKNYLKSSLIFP